ncbi:MAG TPA: hypothetical protein VLZ11_04105 [Flavobacterium sp.]|nr:hypothetical protein [Flavobacterium sp.]
MDKIFFYFFSITLLITISQLVALAKKKEFKSAKFILLSIASIIFIINIYIRIDTVFPSQENTPTTEVEA